MILGIDFSLTATGVCECDSALPRFKITHLETIKTTPRVKEFGVVRELTNQERYEIIINAIQQIGVLTSDFIGIEDFAFGSFGQGLTDLAELQGIARFNLYKDRRKFILISNTMGKKWTTGKGNTKKNMIPMFVQQKYASELLEYGTPIANDNIADAIGIAHIAYTFYRWYNQLSLDKTPTKEELKSLQKLKESNKLLLALHNS